MKTYNDLFTCDQDIENQFQLDKDFLKNNNLKTIYAIYQDQDYSGEAFLVFLNTKTLELFEVNASHCSCHGLEGGFCLEPTSFDSLKIRQTIDDATITFLMFEILRLK